ncbi:MAG: hypothetical protein QNL04_08725 [SAR324 cluster bacterium]|nr:hypothetical protein [SAR324 cluster bacterium]
MQKKTGMTEQEHQDFGSDCQDLQNYLIQSQIFFNQRFGKTKYCALKLAEICKTLEEFRFEMDEIATDALKTKAGTFYYNKPSNPYADPKTTELVKLSLKT